VRVGGNSEFLKVHPVSALPAETQAQLLNGEQVGFVEIGPGEGFPARPVGVRRSGLVAFIGIGRVYEDNRLTFGKDGNTEIRKTF
jgi:hypothetical protein